MNIVIFFTSLNGVKAFVMHLMKGLWTLDDYEVYLFKPAKRTEKFYRHYAGGVHYRNVTMKDLYKEMNKRPTLVATTSPKFNAQVQKLVSKGARVVIHSPLKGDMQVTENNPIVMRKSIQKLVPGSVLLPLPYMTQRGRVKKRYRAIAPARLSSVKHTEIVLEAINQGADIELWGDLMPFYGMYLEKNFPWYKEIWQGPYRMDDGRALFSQFKYMIDLTDTGPDDGGVAQYTTLEAMDTGTIPVIHRNWLGGTMIQGETCLAVNSVEGLKYIIEKRPPKMDFESILDYHDARRVAPQWAKELS